jgi:DnaJ-class molecular chaperone
MFDFNKMVNGGEDIVCCYYCGGKGLVTPKNSEFQFVSKPQPCTVCKGDGNVKVVTNKLW